MKLKIDHKIKFVPVLAWLILWAFATGCFSGKSCCGPGKRFAGNQ